jgi:hypothetical protein
MLRFGRSMTRAKFKVLREKAQGSQNPPTLRESQSTQGYNSNGDTPPEKKTAQFQGRNTRHTSNLRTSQTQPSGTLRTLYQSSDRPQLTWHLISNHLKPDEHRITKSFKQDTSTNQSQKRLSSPTLLTHSRLSGSL